MLSGCAILGSLGTASHLAALKVPPPVSRPGAIPSLTPPATTSGAPQGNTPAEMKSNKLAGFASWYGRKLHGRTTANGERFDMFRMTAAHNDLPFGTMVKVKNLRTGRSVVVRINDRGDLADGQIDLSFAAATQLHMIREGVDPVELEVVGHRAEPVLQAQAQIK